MSEIELKLSKIKPELMEKFQVNKLGYFGSYSIGEQTSDSDLDLLVEFSKPVGWKFFTLEKYIENILGLKIDLVTSSALKKQYKDQILKQVKYI